MPDNEFRNLPQYLRDRPAVRALRLRAYPDGPSAYLVPGRQKVYRVRIIGDEARCECRAADRGLICAHALCAVREHGKSKPITTDKETNMDANVLDGAVRQNRTEFKKTVLHVDEGAHRGYWRGFGDKIVYPNVQCKKCKGTGRFDNKGKDEPHRVCNGTGYTSETKIALLYQLSADLTEEEWVTYAVTPAGTTGNGEPKAASTLFERLQAISQIPDTHDKEYPWEQALVDWYKFVASQGDIKIPISLMALEKGGIVRVGSVKFCATKSHPHPPALPERQPKPKPAPAQRSTQGDELDEIPW